MTSTAAKPCSPNSTPSTWTPRALPTTRSRASSVTALSWLKNSAASDPRKRPAATAISLATSRGWRSPSKTPSASRTSPAAGPTSTSATTTRSRRRCPKAPPARATSATRTTPSRTGSSPRTTTSCLRRPRIRSDAHRGASRTGAPWWKQHPSCIGDASVNIHFPRRQTFGAVLVPVILATMIALGSWHLSAADDSSDSKAKGFSPYVTKDGGISLPLDYREKFLHLGTYAVATKPDKPVHELHNVYTRPEDIQAYRKDGKFPDGAVLVKEITNVGSDKLTTGQSTWDKDVKIWFVMVKD